MHSVMELYIWLGLNCVLSKCVLSLFILLLLLFCWGDGYGDRVLGCLKNIGHPEFRFARPEILEGQDLGCFS